MSSEQVPGGIAFIMSVSNISVLVVDVCAHVGPAISHILNSQTTTRLVVTHNYAEAEKEIAQLLPAVIWLQMNSDHSDGVTRIQRLKQLSPASRLVVIVVEEDEQQAFAAIIAGAQGYCRLQEIEKDGADSVIQVLFRDEFVLRPALRERLMQRVSAAALSTHAGLEGISCLSH